VDLPGQDEPLQGGGLFDGRTQGEGQACTFALDFLLRAGIEQACLVTDDTSTAERPPALPAGFGITRVSRDDPRHHRAHELARRTREEGARGGPLPLPDPALPVDIALVQNREKEELRYLSVHGEILSAHARQHLSTLRSAASILGSHPGRHQGVLLAAALMGADPASTALVMGEVTGEAWTAERVISRMPQELPPVRQADTRRQSKAPGAGAAEEAGPTAQDTEQPVPAVSLRDGKRPRLHVLGRAYNAKHPRASLGLIARDIRRHPQAHSLLLEAGQMMGLQKKTVLRISHAHGIEAAGPARKLSDIPAARPDRAPHPAPQEEMIATSNPVGEVEARIRSEIGCAPRTTAQIASRSGASRAYVSQVVRGMLERREATAEMIGGKRHISRRAEMERLPDAGVPVPARPSRLPSVALTQRVTGPKKRRRDYIKVGSMHFRLRGGEAGMERMIDKIVRMCSKGGVEREMFRREIELLLQVDRSEPGSNAESVQEQGIQGATRPSKIGTEDPEAERGAPPAEQELQVRARRVGPKKETRHYLRVGGVLYRVSADPGNQERITAQILRNCSLMWDAERADALRRQIDDALVRAGLRQGGEGG